MSGWESLPHEFWIAFCERMPRPWPREFAIMDLRWLAAERMLYGRAFPSRPELVRRWGDAGPGFWTDKRVRGLLASDWQDPVRPWTLAELRGPLPVTKRADEGPTKGRRRADEGPTRDGATPETASRRADEGPTKGRRRADEGPHARSSSAPSQDTEHRGSSSGTAAAAPAADPPSRPERKRSRPPNAADGAKPQPKHPGYHEAIAAFSAEHETIRGTKYPWVFAGRQSDAGRVKVWLAAAQVNAGDVDAGVERIRGAARAYLRAVDAGVAWPEGEPASTRHFTREIARWLQTDPEAQPRGPPSRRSRADDTSEALDMLAAARQRLKEKEQQHASLP